MATSVQDFLKQNPGYIGYSNTGNRTAPVAPAKKASGVGGFLGGIARDIAHPFAYFGDVAIGNPTREIAAQLTGNREALANADKRSRKTLAGNNGDLSSALKMLAGNTGQLGLTLTAPAAKSIKGAATVGAGYGGSSALSRDKSLEEVLQQTAIGAGLGVAGRGASRLVGRGATKTSPATGTKVTRAGERGLGEVRGIFGGAQVGGKQVNSQRAREINQFLNNDVKAGGALATQLEKTANYRTGLLDELNGLLRANNYQLNRTELNAISKAARERINSTEIPGLNKAGRTASVDFLDGLKGVKDLEGLNKFRIGLDQAINYARNEASPDPLREQVAMALRKAIDKHLTTKISDGSTLKQAMSKAYDAEALLGKTIRSQTGGKGDVRALEILRNSAPVQAARTSINARMAGGAAPTPLAPSATGGSLSQALGNVPRMGLPAAPVSGSLALRQGQPQTSPETEPEDTTLYGAMAAQDGVGGQLQEPPQQSAYTLEQALADLQAHPDAKSQKNIMDYYSFVNDAETARAKASGSGGPNVTKVTAQQYSLAQRGQQALQQMSQLLQEDPGVLSRTATPGRKLPVVGGFISNAAGTGKFDAIGYNIASSLLRIETGAQANESEIRNLQSQMIPRAGDSQQTIAQKLQQLNQAFSVITNAANNNYAETPQQLQGAY